VELRLADVSAVCAKAVGRELLLDLDDDRDREKKVGSVENVALVSAEVFELGE